LPLQNYFSVFYPDIDTSTEGKITFYSHQGEFIGEKHFTLVHRGGAKYSVSSILKDLNATPPDGYGTLEVHIEIPRDVLKHIRPQRSFYFWDRFYIGYSGPGGQVCFVHGVDKSNIYPEGESLGSPWYELPGGYSWAPEIPVNIDQYKKFSVIMINRTSIDAEFTLTVTDNLDCSLSWSETVAPSGVHRFELAQEMMPELEPTELRMRIDGMASEWGRPAVFKEFPNGAVSAMHC
jgi:hypothetical protein